MNARSTLTFVGRGFATTLTMATPATVTGDTAWTTPKPPVWVSNDLRGYLGYMCAGCCSNETDKSEILQTHLCFLLTAQQPHNICSF